MTLRTPGDSPDAIGDTPVWTVLCVDDEPNILSAMQRMFRGNGYRVLVAEGGLQALQTLASESVHLIISDMTMPLMNGAQLLEQVRRRWPVVTRMLLTGCADLDSAVAAINHGEVFRYIAKPWNEDEVRFAVREAFEQQELLHKKARLERVVVHHYESLSLLNASLKQQVAERTAQLCSAKAQLDINYLRLIKMFSNLIELRGGPMASHSRSVGRLARRIAIQMQLPAEKVREVFVSGLLHDIGHVGLSDDLLGETVSCMTPSSKALYIKHCVLGEQALITLEDMQVVASNVRSHHERFDGSGFPDGLKGDAIPLGARILAVADTFDDLQSGHLAPTRLTIPKAIAIIERGRGTEFDASVVDAFGEVMRATAALVPAPFVKPLPRDLKPGMGLVRDLNWAKVRSAVDQGSFAKR